MTEQRKPLDSALDLLVYLPVGLAVTATEEFPKVAAKGRARVATQVAMARVVGQFAVGQARRLVEDRLSQMRAPTSADANWADAAIVVTDVTGAASAEHSEADLAEELISAEEAEITYSELLGSSNGSHPDAPRRAGPVGPPPEASAGPVGPPPEASAGPVGPPPEASGLAIPGYDSLSASQVVQRLAGLSSDELEAVRAYESAHRARRTVLTRVSQLQSS